MSAGAIGHLDGDIRPAGTAYVRAAYDARLAARRASARAAQAASRVAVLQRGDAAWTLDPRRAAERAWLARNRARAALVRLADAHERAAANCDALGLAHAAMRHRIAAAGASDRIDHPPDAARGRAAARAPADEHAPIGRQTGAAAPAGLTVPTGSGYG